MPKLKSLTVVVALLLPSCAVYMHDDHRPRHGYAGAPCDRPEGPYGYGRRLGVIGVSIARAEGERRGPIVVDRVMPDGPAANADIRPGDRIRAIDGESTRGMTVTEAAQLIRGRADTSVELRVDSPRGSRLITLVRVPPCAMHGGMPCGGRRCDRCRDGEYGRPCGHRERMEPPPPVDESADDDVSPPTKPGHTF